MRKILFLTVVLALLVPLWACSSKAEEEPITGKVFDAGRFSILVPEGWSAVDLGENGEKGTIGTLVKGEAEEFGTASQMTIYYNLPSDPSISSREYYDNAVNLKPLDLGGYHWQCWQAFIDGQPLYAAEAYGDFGSLMIFLVRFSAEEEALSLEDRDIRAMLESIILEEYEKSALQEDGTA